MAKLPEGGGSGGARGLRSRGSTVADWGQADPVKIVGAIERASITGGALRFGYSADGGAYAVGIYGDGDKPYTVWLPPTGDLDVWLEDITDLFQSIYDDQMAVRGIGGLSKGKKTG